MGFYTAGALAAVARVRNNQVRASDAAMGAVLGITAGISAVNREEMREGSSPAPGSGFRVIPSGRGVTVVYRLR
jgi:hypothetical protein